MVQAALNAGHRERLKASPLNLMFGRKPYSIFSALVAPGKDEWQVDNLDPDSVQVMMRGLMDAQEIANEKVLGLIRKNRARMRGVENKEVLPDFGVEDYVLLARVKQPGITPKLMNTCTGPVDSDQYNNRRTSVRRGRHRHGAFARGTCCADAAVCRCIAQRHREAEGGNIQ